MECDWPFLLTWTAFWVGVAAVAFAFRWRR